VIHWYHCSELSESSSRTQEDILTREMCEVIVRITDIGNHPPEIVDDMKICLIESLSSEPQEVGEMRVSLQVSLTNRFSKEPFTS